MRIWHNQIGALKGDHSAMRRKNWKGAMAGHGEIISDAPEKS